MNKQLEHSPYYTDTDSIQIHQRNLKDITLDNEIGGISDDLGDNCKILYGGWIAPKLYFLEYVERSGKIWHHFRGKGVPKDKLNIEMFEQMMTGESVTIEMTRDFKRIHVNKNSTQQEVDNFSVLKLDSIYKEINTSQWSGRHFYGNASVPHGHSSV